MPKIGYRLMIASLAFLLAAADQPPTVLQRGINITHWFRFPPSQDPAALRSYMNDAALEELKRAGFTFLRLPVQPELLTASDALTDAVARAQRHGLAVVVTLFPTDWHLETEPADQARLVSAWRLLAAVLHRFSPAATFPELLNEPVFANDQGAWARLQHQALATVRSILPADTIILTGAGWGGVDGLLALPPEADSNVIYSFHLYEPAELTALGAYHPGLDSAAMARLPFPVTDEGACLATAGSTHDPPTADLMRFYCSQHWDAAKVAARIDEAGAWALHHHVPVLAGEVGASELLNAPARLAWLSTVRQACEQHHIGWALWGYDDLMGFSLHPPGDRRRPDSAVLNALGLSVTK